MGGSTKCCGRRTLRSRLLPIRSEDKSWLRHGGCGDVGKQFALKKEEEYEEDDFNDSKMESEPVTREVLLKLLLKGLNHTDSTVWHEEQTARKSSSLSFCAGKNGQDGSECRRASGPESPTVQDLPLREDPTAEGRHEQESSDGGQGGAGWASRLCVLTACSRHLRSMW